MIKLLTYDVTNRPQVSAAPSSHHRKLTILLSQPRSGSSWIGSFFDSHPDVFYIYEPLHPQVYRDSKIHLTAEKFQEEILRNLCRCEFTEEIISHGIQERSSKVSRSKGMLGVLSPNADELSEQCKRSKHTIAKVLQLKHFQMFTSLSKECEINVIHLIRDPRASIKSRMDTFKRFLAEEQEIEEFTPDIIADSSHKICTEITTRANQLQRHNHLLQYSTILYENVVKNPLEKAKELFRTVGIDWSASVEKRVLHSISGSSEGGGFDTVKDTSRLLGRWRREAGEEYIRAVEQGCTQLMSTVGYPLMFPDT
ncbi:carbohydrate sulfotransferase 3-like [Bolinopsis microptera]|uniref:carbohydrate sulfotransferase 3-like n=1 Tax=Bolinopsis microptera TaxID=2820187 RepID=UPI003079EC9A